MNLLTADYNKELRIKNINKGWRATRKLENLGLREGVTIRKVSQQPFRGPIIINKGNSRIALGNRMAQSIEVEYVNE